MDESNIAGFEEIEHTADRAYRIRGRDAGELFAHAMRGMFSVENSTAVDGEATVTRELEVAGPDHETLLVNWLNELLYLQEAHGETYGEADFLELTPRKLRARVHGRPDPEAQRIIKAATFHDLAIRQDAQGWEATVVFDV